MQNKLQDERDLRASLESGLMSMRPENTSCMDNKVSFKLTQSSSQFCNTVIIYCCVKDKGRFRGSCPCGSRYWGFEAETFWSSWATYSSTKPKICFLMWVMQEISRRQQSLFWVRFLFIMHVDICSSVVANSSNWFGPPEVGCDSE